MATNEQLIPIPGRLHSVASEGHVASADEIYDDTLQKLQSEINSDVKVMGASGTNHSKGLVPDPGATAGTTKYLREDGSWAVPEGSNTDVNYDTTNKKVTKTINNVTSDVVTAATIVEDGGGVEVEVGDTAPIGDVKLFVDEDADPSEAIDVYNKTEIDQKLAFSYDSTTKGLLFPTDTSIVEYDSTEHAIVFHG